MTGTLWSVVIDINVQLDLCFFDSVRSFSSQKILIPGIE